MIRRNIILDMGGVLMQHNIPGCIARLKELTGANFPRLGMDDIEVNRLAAQRAVGWRTAESLEALKAIFLCFVAEKTQKYLHIWKKCITFAAENKNTQSIE